MNAVTILRKIHNKELPSTRLQEEVNTLLEHLKHLMDEGYGGFTESDENSRWNEINVDLVLRERLSLITPGKENSVKRHSSIVTSRGQKHLNLNGRVISQGEKNGYFADSLTKMNRLFETAFSYLKF